jgi:hypothetical protein
MKVGEVKEQLIALEEEVNYQVDSGFVHIEFDQQSVKEENMSFTEGNGRIYVKPFIRLKKYEIALAGTAIEMYPFMRDLCRAECAGENHRGKTHPEPYWRVDDFEIVKKAVYHYARKPGTSRLAIETPVPQAMSEAPENADRETLVSWLAENERRASTLPESELFRRAAMSDAVARKVTLTGTAFIRDSYVAASAKKLADGVCDLCKKEAPFLSANNEPYLESHHIDWLSHGGADLIDNVVALCPNCHRKMHIRNDEADRNILIRRIIGRKHLL